MIRAPFEVGPFIGQDEGQHFDRKSLFEGPEGQKRPRDRRSVRDQVAEYVAAFANAEGGVLLLGIEDDGSATGHRYPADAVRAILDTPRARLRPPQPEGFLVEHAGVELLVFDVPISDVPVQVDGDGFPLRIGDKTVQASESQIQSLKFRGLVESWESRPSRMALADLDPALLARAKAGSGLGTISDEEYLLKRKLADRRGRDVALRRGAELLFASDGPDHPNAGVRIFRVVGAERRLGAEHNVEERPRIEGNLGQVLPAVFAAVDGLVRRPSRLVGNRFRAVPEYPEFSWKEAILNAVAHRDYTTEGRTTEVWFFDDRLEVTNPGGLVPDVALEDLLSLRRVHVSRNPRTVRALVDLGFMRDQGEGIPRMFAEMEGLFLPAPVLDPSPREFRITLRNTPTLTAEDRSFVASLGDEELTDLDFRALLEAHRHGRIDNARMRQISGLDTLGASQLLRRLRDRELLTLHPAGSASFYELGPTVRSRSKSRARPLAGLPAEEQLELPTEEVAERGELTESSAADRGELTPDRGELTPDRGELTPDRGELTPDRGELTGGSGADRGELAADRGDLEDVPPSVREFLGSLGPRPRRDRLRQAILRLTELRAWKPPELAGLLGLADAAKLVERHLSPMVTEGLLERTHPENLRHPEQAYRARKDDPAASRDKEDDDDAR
ncbi:ATP-binding protein [Sorangium sp. So ce1335]|uniref:ATP-binding protein n=1 Tax=Sorangium sp. So ce1335 TaxID=3133335 RepID=UPI003F60522A